MITPQNRHPEHAAAGEESPYPKTRALGGKEILRSVRGTQDDGLGASPGASRNA